MNSDAQKPMVFSQDGEVFLRVVTDITLYWRGSLFDRAAGIQNFFDQALKLIGSHIKFYRTESMEGSKPLRADTLQWMPKLLNGRKRKTIHMLSLESGLNADEPSEHAFYFLADEEEEIPVGLMRLILPQWYMETGYSSVSGVLQALLDGMAFDSGHAGYAVNWDPEGEWEDEGARQMLVLAKKYPGIDLNYMDSTIIALQNADEAGIKCVNWLTMLGPSLQKRLPESAQLRKALGDDCPIHVLPSAWVIQAGPAPALGYPDSAALDPYRRVGAELASLRLEDHPAIFAESDPSGYTTEDWLARFD